MKYISGIIADNKKPSKKKKRVVKENEYVVEVTKVSTSYFIVKAKNEDKAVKILRDDLEGGLTSIKICIHPDGTLKESYLSFGTNRSYNTNLHLDLINSVKKHSVEE